jgi:ribonuclease D
MTYVDTAEALDAAAEQIVQATLVAADTEAAGFHRYHDRICLLQLSTREATFVVDTLALEHLRPLAQPFADPDVEVVFHDADYDLRLLFRDFGLRVRGLFDTKIAAQFLGEPSIGLASLLERYLGVKLEKKYQRADWAQRPLSSPMLEYAALDTAHLPALRDTLRERLQQAGRLEWAEEEFRVQESASREPPDGPADQAYLRMKGIRDLRPRQLGALQALHAWREQQARDRDLAPFRVLPNEVLIELARQMPRSLAEAASLPTLPRSLIGRYGSALMEILDQVRSMPESALPQRPSGPSRPPPDPELEQLVDQLKNARDHAASALGLDRGFLLPRHQLEDIARSNPDSPAALAAIPGIRRWQIQAVGEPLLQVLNAPRPSASRPRHGRPR